MKCPSCKVNAGTVSRCEKCGDVRCNVGGCVGSNGVKGGGHPGHQCKSCKSGTYKKIS